ncbi:Uncharacterised protein [Mycobacteroides abscessus]|nr:Uncharacterised protein [Mycobacteroides abscessus]
MVDGAGVEPHEAVVAPLAQAHEHLVRVHGLLEQHGEHEGRRGAEARGGHGGLRDGVAG